MSQQCMALVNNCIWRINLNTLKWEKLRIKMPILTYFHASCMSQSGQVWLHGGVTHKQNREDRVNDLFTIKLRIQRLSDICWEKLLDSYPKLIDIDHTTLKSIGLPLNYIDRIN